MKYLFIILTICLFSCNDYTPHAKEIRIVLHEDFSNYSSFVCDSATMLSKKEAEYWINGYKGKVMAGSYISFQNP